MQLPWEQRNAPILSSPFQLPGFLQYIPWIQMDLKMHENVYIYCSQTVDIQTALLTPFCALNSERVQSMTSTTDGSSSPSTSPGERLSSQLPDCVILWEVTRHVFYFILFNRRLIRSIIGFSVCHDLILQFCTFPIIWGSQMSDGNFANMQHDLNRQHVCFGQCSLTFGFLGSRQNSFQFVHFTVQVHRAFVIFGA